MNIVLSLTIFLFLSTYILGLYYDKFALRLPALIAMFMYACIIWIESSAAYHRRCLRYHEEE